MFDTALLTLSCVNKNLNSLLCDSSLVLKFIVKPRYEKWNVADRVFFPLVLELIEARLRINKHPDDIPGSSAPRALTALNLLNLVDIATTFGARDASDANMAYQAGRFGFLAYVDLLTDYNQFSVDATTLLELQSEASHDPELWKNLKPNVFGEESILINDYQFRFHVISLAASGCAFGGYKTHAEWLINTHLCEMYKHFFTVYPEHIVPELSRPIYLGAARGLHWDWIRDIIKRAENRTGPSFRICLSPLYCGVAKEIAKYGASLSEMVSLAQLPFDLRNDEKCKLFSNDEIRETILKSLIVSSISSGREENVYKVLIQCRRELIHANPEKFGFTVGSTPILLDWLSGIRIDEVIGGPAERGDRDLAELADRLELSLLSPHWEDNESTEFLKASISCGRGEVI